MLASVKALLTEVIDYAGLFPPAKLGMAESVAKYVDLVESDASWIVNRFACPAGRLSELAVELSNHPGDPFVPIAVIGHACEDRGKWADILERDSELMSRFQEEAENHAEIEAYEIRVPDLAHVGQYARDLRSFDQVDLFLELPWGPDMKEAIAVLSECEWAGAKVRTGGTDAAAFPNVAQLAAFLHECASLEVPFKLTAGLHHAMPHRDQQLGAAMHGFVNVLGSVALAVGADLTEREIQQALADSNAGNWRFDEEGLYWHNHAADLEAISAARDIMLSFGSCSVEEPLESLARFRWLEARV